MDGLAPEPKLPGSRIATAGRVRALESYYDRYNAWATVIVGLTRCRMRRTAQRLDLVG